MGLLGRGTGRETTWTRLLVLALALSACDREMAYLPEELAIEARFRGIEAGSSEQDVRARLGEPICVLYAIPGSREELEVRCPESSSPGRLRAGDRSTWPAKLPGLPRQLPSFRALVYVDARVSAYYLLDAQGRVEFVQVRMS
jgi:hypothetical protein